jgi:hypothetical protein
MALVATLPSPPVGVVTEAIQLSVPQANTPVPEGFGVLGESYRAQLDSRLDAVHARLESLAAVGAATGRVHVIEASVTSEHAVVPIAIRDGGPLRNWLAFANQVFPDSRNMTPEERAAFNAINDAHLEDLDAPIEDLGSF